MLFAPPDQAERTQIRLFAGADELQSEFDAAFIRLRPSDFEAKFRAESLAPRPVVQADLRRATEVFDEFLCKTLQIDLTDLSRDRWSLVPTTGDLIAEVRTRRFGNLTYARSGNEAEDITVFDRRRRRNISHLRVGGKTRVARALLQRGRPRRLRRARLRSRCRRLRPDRYWMNGTAHLRVRVRAAAMTTMTLKLAEAFAVRGVYAPGFGRLLHLRVVNQNSLIVNLPTPVFRDNEFTLTVVYSGRLEPTDLDREAIAVQAQQQDREPTQIPLEPRFIYSNNSFWYPQSTVSDYALGTLRVTVPAEYRRGGDGHAHRADQRRRARRPPAPIRRGKTFIFQNDRPVRYLSCVVSRMQPVVATRLPIRSSLAISEMSGSLSPIRWRRPSRRRHARPSVAEPSAAAGCRAATKPASH